MNLDHSGLLRAGPAAVLVLLCLAALIALLACGGEQAVPPVAATEAPAQPTDAPTPPATRMIGSVESFGM